MNNGGKEGGERKWEFVRSLGGRGRKIIKKCKDLLEERAS